MSPRPAVSVIPGAGFGGCRRSSSRRRLGSGGAGGTACRDLLVTALFGGEVGRPVKVPRRRAVAAVEVVPGCLVVVVPGACAFAVEAINAARIVDAVNKLVDFMVGHQQWKRDEVDNNQIWGPSPRVDITSFGGRPRNTGPTALRTGPSAPYHPKPARKHQARTQSKSFFGHTPSECRLRRLTCAERARMTPAGRKMGTYDLLHGSMREESPSYAGGPSHVGAS